MKLPLIGPHEGREFELMEQGRKDVALFYDIIPDEYEVLKNKEAYDAVEWESVGEHEGREICVPYRILFRKGYEAQAHRLAEIQQNYGEALDIEKEREIGEILGYPKDAIEHFVEKLKSQ